MSNWISLAAVLIIIALLLTRFITSGANRVDSKQAHELVAHGAQLLDVRSPGEYGAAHLDGAINVPVDQLSTKAIRALPSKDKALVVYCRSGARSARAKKMLEGMGYVDVHDLGAMSRW